MKDYSYQLNDIVEMKKPHPCFARSKYFKIIRLGADLKIECQGCKKVLIITRDNFNQRFKRVVKKEDNV